MGEKIVYDDHICKIEITEADFPGCYFVITNDDGETSVPCTSLKYAEDYAEIARDEMVEDYNVLYQRWKERNDG